jgi:hypothetical protein
MLIWWGYGDAGFDDWWKVSIVFVGTGVVLAGVVYLIKRAFRPKVDKRCPGPETRAAVDTIEKAEKLGAWMEEAHSVMSGAGNDALKHSWLCSKARGIRLIRNDRTGEVYPMEQVKVVPESEGKHRQKTSMIEYRS